jgi:signal peptidase I
MKKGKKKAVTGIGLLLTVVLGLALFLYLNFRMVQVSGVSMLPQLQDGQRVLVSRAYWLIGPLRHKDVVLIRDEGPTGFMIKRIHYMPGERVDWKWVPDTHRLSEGEYVVPEGEVFVIGDNKPHSEDSRRFGPVKLSDVLGKVVVLP